MTARTIYRLAFLCALFVLAPRAAAQSTPSLFLYDEGSRLRLRYRLNFTGSGVACVDNPTLARTDCSISGGGSITWPLTNGTSTNTYTYGGATGSTAHLFNTTNAATANDALAMFKSAGTEKATLLYKADGFRLIPDGIATQYLHLASSDAAMCSGSTCVGLSFFVPGVELRASNVSAAIATSTALAPGDDAAITVGKVGKRFLSAYLGAVVASRPACAVANDEGQLFVLQATAGNKSAVQACLKGADDAFHWETVYQSAN